MNEDRRFRLFVRGIDGLFALFRTGAIIVGVVLIASYARDVLVAFAGKETAANLALSLIVNLQADRWLPIYSAWQAPVMVSSSGNLGVGTSEE